MHKVINICAFLLNWTFRVILRLVGLAKKEERKEEGGPGCLGLHAIGSAHMYLFACHRPAHIISISVLV